MLFHISFISSTIPFSALMAQFTDTALWEVCVGVSVTHTTMHCRIACQMPLNLEIWSSPLSWIITLREEIKNIQLWFLIWCWIFCNLFFLLISRFILCFTVWMTGTHYLSHFVFLWKIKDAQRRHTRVNRKDTSLFLFLLFWIVFLLLLQSSPPGRHLSPLLKLLHFNIFSDG